MTTKFYKILFKKNGQGESWKELSETEFTEKEANRELRGLRECDSLYIFRKKFLYSAETQIAAARV